MRWTGHVASVGGNDKCVFESLNVRDKLEDLGIVGRIILTRSFLKS
jgi:predicted enzyme involved in methoxymalonyl-ACP biosynthesis